MSEPNGWASTNTVIEMLQAATAVDGIEFYVLKSDNRNAELHCRCPGFTSYSKADMEALAVELNVAIKPVLRKLSQTLHNRAANQLRRHL